MLSPRTTQIVVGLVSVVWAINFAAGIFVHEYEADQAINGIFMAIVGGALALGSRKGKDGGGGADGE